ncbi:fasciclin domain-containing protein [Microbispora sp. NPDC049633]|uniref:fasciclin domain-containing protein n=1 Tax=Microbispora sp. NPDC049633 TaxID=3154355 RepID=UPI0034266466
MTGTEAMGERPVATAIAGVPDLSKMASALSRGNLAQYLDSAKDITVFVPVNDAFVKLPKFELDRMFSDEDKDWTRQVLTYHVTEGRKTRDELSNAKLTTKEGHELTTRLSGQDLVINNDAKVLCGEIQTANATVYLIDKVLIP